MVEKKIVIFGFGDIGQRIAAQLLDCSVEAKQIIAVRRSVQLIPDERIFDLQVDLDQSIEDLSLLQGENLIYLVPPPLEGVIDSRSRNLLTKLTEQNILLRKIVLISTTGVYGDCAGEWVTELHPTNPQTDRGKRRLDAERQWSHWSKNNVVPITILRVPGIYARNRLPVARLESGVPVVRAQDCGFTNRIHADDLAMVVLAALNSERSNEIVNVSDGMPGKVGDYLQHAAATLGLPQLPEISLSEAQSQLSDGMLSYLAESRKISNAKMLKQLKVTLCYPDFKVGLRH